MRNKNDDLDALCRAGDGDDCADSSELRRFNQTRQQAEASETRQVALYIAGGLLLSAGITVLVLDAASEPSVAIDAGPNYAGIVVRGGI